MDLKNYSESIMIIPLRYLGEKNQEFKSLIDTGDEKCIWRSEQPKGNYNKYKYLTKNINLLAFDKDVSICSFYHLNNDMKSKHQIPKPDIKITMLSEFFDGSVKEYFFYLTNIRLIYFTTKIGFILIYIKHPINEGMDVIADKMFALSRFFINEHDSENKKSYLKFNYCENGENINFSLKNSILSIMSFKGDNIHDKIELFYDASIKKTMVYHRLFYTESPKDFDRNLYFLRRNLNSKSIYSDEKDFRNNRDITYYPYDNVSWSMSPQGVVSLSICEAECLQYDFLVNKYQKNVMSNYFFLYLLQLHERQALLYYNYIATQNRKDTKKLSSMKESLLSFKVCFSPNVVSEESAYQNFYECIYDIFNLNKLEEDIQEIIEKIDEYENSCRDRKMNNMLSIITIMGIISVIVDGFAFIDRIIDSSQNALSIYHKLLMLVTTLSIFIIIIYLKKQKRNNEF